MHAEAARKVPWSFRVNGVVALIWNVLGSVNFFVQMDPRMLAAYRASERAIVEGRPAWATLGFAVAVFGGTIGCVLLLGKRSSAYYFFIASFLGAIVTMIHTLTIGVDYGFGEIVGIILLPLAVAAFLVWYARFSRKKGWIS